MRILRGLSSRRLACGCLVGLYETYSGEVTEILDYHDPACTNRRHRVGAVVTESDEHATDKPVDPAEASCSSR